MGALQIVVAVAIIEAIIIIVLFLIVKKPPPADLSELRLKAGPLEMLLKWVKTYEQILKERPTVSKRQMSYLVALFLGVAQGLLIGAGSFIMVRDVITYAIKSTRDFKLNHCTGRLEALQKELYVLEPSSLEDRTKLLEEVRTITLDILQHLGEKE